MTDPPESDWRLILYNGVAYCIHPTEPPLWYDEDGRFLEPADVTEKVAERLREIAVLGAFAT